MKKILLACWVGLMVSPVLSQPKERPFQKDIQAFARQDSLQVPPQEPILFIGSSSFTFWKEVQKDFPGYTILNRGFGGSHISDVNYYFNSIVAIYKPRIIVLYAGDNDIASKKTPEQVLADYKDFVTLVHRDLPKTKLIYLPIKPSPSRRSMWKNMKQANSLIKMYIESDKTQYYSDTATPMLDITGKPYSDLFVSDSLHLSEKGYDLWSKVLTSTLDSLTMLERPKIFGW